MSPRELASVLPAAAAVEGETGSASPGSLPEHSFDPRDERAFRRRAHEMLDRMLDLHRDVRDRPVWRPVPESVEERFSDPVPRAGKGIDGAWQAFEDQVLPYPTGNIHPRFWGWVSGTGSPSGLVAEMLAGGLNSISGIFDDAAARVEDQVVDWMREALGLGDWSSGVLTSGGSVANLVGLAVARDTAGDSEIPLRGVRSAAGPLALYASTETHSSVHKAAQILGLGREAVRPVPVDDSWKIDPVALTEAIARDRAAGWTPFAVVGNAGTVNTGAVDDLVALSTIAGREGLWLHVDGAFGALARLSSAEAWRLRGLERADSVAFDFHKWMCVPYEAGCVLVREAGAHRHSFAVAADYLETLPRGVGARRDSTNLRGLQLSRGFKALKVWMLLQEHGLDRFAALVDANCAQARTLAARIDREPELERLAPVALNVVCFRFRPTGPARGPEALDAVNREILMRLHERGLAVPSSTRLHGRFALRVAITNHRSRDEDFDFLADRTIELGREILAEAGPSPGVDGPRASDPIAAAGRSRAGEGGETGRGIEPSSR